MSWLEFCALILNSFHHIHSSKNLLPFLVRCTCILYLITKQNLPSLTNTIYIFNNKVSTFFTFEVRKQGSRQFKHSFEFIAKQCYLEYFSTYEHCENSFHNYVKFFKSAGTIYDTYFTKLLEKFSLVDCLNSSHSKGLLFLFFKFGLLHELKQAQCFSSSQTYNQLNTETYEVKRV